MPFAPPQQIPFDTLTQGADHRKGGVNVYHKNGRYYLDIPERLFHRDIIWYAEINRAPLVSGMMGFAASPGSMIDYRLIRLERHESKLWIRDYTAPLDLRAPILDSAEDTDLLNQSLAESNLPSILLAVPIVSEGPEGSAVIDGSALFGQNLEQFDITKKVPGLGMPDIGRSYVSEVMTFEQNLRVLSVLTFQVTGNSHPLMQLFARINSKAATVEVEHSIYTLPEQAMRPRLADPRIGYFSTGFQEILPEGGSEQKAYISRFRLEKKDPDAERSEPVEPIVFYIGPHVPDRWRPVFKEAVEYWNEAFEEAGFRKAVVALDPPDDPHWDPNDLGHSVIRWVRRPVANAMGPSVVDPRSGEILAAHLLIWQDVITLASSWYYFQGSGVDERARSLPLPEELENAVMHYVVAHEVGHALGLRHNHRASQAYTIEQLRDPDFANAHGPVASIMSYGRINYVAQPGDGVTELLPRIGPYDQLAIRYGYQPIPGAESPEDEVPVLNEWLRAQRTDPVLQFGGEDEAAIHDPTVLVQNVGSDRIRAAELGLKNLQRAVGYLPAAIGDSPQKMNALRRYYRMALHERSNWLKAAAKELYGVKENRSLDPAEDQYEIVSPGQKKAVTQFLLEQLEKAPELITPDMKRLFMPYQLSGMLTKAQTAILDGLLDPKIFNSFWDAELLGEETYTVAQYLEDLFRGLFAELEVAEVHIGPVRRELQRLFVNYLKGLIEPPSGGLPPAILPGLPPSGRSGAGLRSPDVRGAARLVLHELEVAVKGAQQKTTHIDTQAHLYDLQKEIEKVL